MFFSFVFCSKCVGMNIQETRCMPLYVKEIAAQIENLHHPNNHSPSLPHFHFYCVFVYIYKCFFVHSLIYVCSAFARWGWNIQLWCYCCCFCCCCCPCCDPNNFRMVNSLRTVSMSRDQLVWWFCVVLCIHWFTFQTVRCSYFVSFCNDLGGWIKCRLYRDTYV